MFTPLGPAAVTAAALKSETCLALRMDGDPTVGEATDNPCAAQKVEASWIVRDFVRCPLTYIAVGEAFGVMVCRNPAAASVLERDLLADDHRTGDAANSTRVANVIVYGGKLMLFRVRRAGLPRSALAFVQALKR